MSTPVEIEVAAEDIRDGKRCNSWECPVALAGTRAFGCRVRVGFADFRPRVLLTANGVVYEVRDAYAYVRKFDDSLDAVPMQLLAYRTDRTEASLGWT